jgi:hypothetical protein
MSIVKKNIAILIPTRERSNKINTLYEQWFKMIDKNISTDCIIILDKDNENTYPRLDGFIYKVSDSCERRGMTYPLNQIASTICNEYEYLGFWGDDHFPLTMNWNSIMYNKLQTHAPYSMVYSDNLQHQHFTQNKSSLDDLYVFANSVGVWNMDSSTYEKIIHDENFLNSLKLLV